MTQVALSLGSNSNAEHYLLCALDALHEKYGDLCLSSVYESESVGFDGANFLNLVVLINTDEALGELALFLKALEARHGRSATESKFSGRTLDIDILTYGDLAGEISGIRLPREEIVDNAYVLWPMAEIMGQVVHAPSGLSYSALWQAYDKRRQRLWSVKFFWQGRAL